MATYTITEAQRMRLIDWLKGTNNFYMRAATTLLQSLASAPQTQEPHVWMIQGSHGTWEGEHAEMDAKAEAKRCGGTCYAYPLYTHPELMRILTDAERLEREKAGKRELR